MASTYTPIATTTLGSAAASVTFTGIPSTYTDLVLISTPIVTSATTFGIRFNSDTNTNYSFTTLNGDGTSATSARGSNESYLRISYVGTSRTTNTSQIITNIMNYANSTTYKTAISRDGAASDGSGAQVGLWRKTPETIGTVIIVPISGGTIINTGSTFTLYGIKAA
jgi:hypothetical protein